MQQQRKRSYVKGYIDLEIIGSLASQPTQLTLSDISTVSKKDVSFSFKYFQIIEGTFILPENFIPEKMQISAILTKTKWQKYQKLNKTLAWRLE